MCGSARRSPLYFSALGVVIMSKEREFVAKSNFNVRFCRNSPVKRNGPSTQVLHILRFEGPA